MITIKHIYILYSPDLFCPLRGSKHKVTHTIVRALSEEKNRTLRTKTPTCKRRKMNKLNVTQNVNYCKIIQLSVNGRTKSRGGTPLNGKIL